MNDSIWLVHIDQVFKFIFMFLVGAFLVGLPKYLGNLPSNEEISKRYLWASIILHGSMGIMAGILILFLPTDNLLVLGGMSALFSYLGVDIIKRVAIQYAANKFDIKINNDDDDK